MRLGDNHAARMRAELIAAIRARGGICTRDEACGVAAVHVVDDAVRVGALRVAAPAVYALPELPDNTELRRRVALAHHRDGALSHTDALDVWGLPGALDGSVHVTVRGDHSACLADGVKLHRRRYFRDEPGVVRVRDGLRVVRIEQAVIDSWPLLPALDQRAPAIIAVRDRRTTGARLLASLAKQPWVPGARQMGELFGLLDSGLHSELEIWGHANVFTDSRLPPSTTQRAVRVGSRRVYLDRAFDDVMLDVELDGAAYHGTPGQRERDLRRDAALARLGWLTVRYSHPRLHAEPAEIVGEVLDIITTRRRQFGRAS